MLSEVAKDVPKHMKRFGVTRSANGFMLFSAVVSLFVSVYLECAYEVAGLARTGIAAGLLFASPTVGSVVRALFAFAVCFVAIWLLSSRTLLLHKVYRYRYPLALALLAVLVLLELSGTSLGWWGNLLGEDPFKGVLFGIPRDVRGDEYLIFTPFTFSQSYEGYPAINSLIRGCATDVTLVYGQPAWALATLFRPFLWGHLLMGPVKGLSFFWCGRAIFVVLATFECMRVITDGDKRLSLYGALLVGFSPIFEWWFAVNGIAELLIFGQGLVVVIHYLLRTTNVRKRLAWSAALAWFAGCYVMVIYPAWQVCLAYVFGFMVLGDMIRWLSSLETSKGRAFLQALPFVLGALVLAIACVGICIFLSRDALNAIFNTAYPGSRVITGGNGPAPLLYCIFAPLTALFPYGFPVSVCERGGYISLFPLGILLSVYAMVRGAIKGRVDKILLAMIVPYIFFVWYIVIGIPEFLAKVTLMGRAFDSRVTLGLGYLDIALLIRSLVVVRQMREDAVQQEQTLVKTMLRGGAALAVALTFVLVAHWYAPDYMTGKHLLLFAIFAILLVPLFLPDSFFAKQDRSRGTWLVASSLVIVAVGMCVNPLVKGADVVTKSDTLTSIRQVVESDPDALWIGDSATEGQAALLAGASSISSVNIYPNLERWRALDPQGIHEAEYNRYAHIAFEMGETTSFSNTAVDALAVTLAPEDLLKLGATYWLSKNDLASYQSDVLRFEAVREAGPFTIYRIVQL